jgi:hypothetical protein
MNVGGEPQPVRLGQVEIVQRQDGAAQAPRGQQGRELRGQGGLARALRPGQADDERAAGGRQDARGETFGQVDRQGRGSLPWPSEAARDSLSP